MEISQKIKADLSIKQHVPISEDMLFTIDEAKKLTSLSINGILLELPSLQLETPFIVKTKMGIITIEDLETHPMNLANRWDILKDLPDYKISDHQMRFIITFEGSNILESFIVPKILEEAEPIARVVLCDKSSPIPFIIEMAEVKYGKIQSIIPQKPEGQSKILLGTQILGHVQDAAKILRWAKNNGTLQSKWRFVLPATKRTEVTKDSLRKESILVDELISDWSYAGGKDFRTGYGYKEDFSKQESFSTVAAFIAANAGLCIDVVKGKYAIVSTNFRAETQILREINPSIITVGVSHTFLTGKLKERINLHNHLPRLVKMFQQVQESLDLVPKRVVTLGGDIKYIDYYWKVSNEKIQMLDTLLYRTFNIDPKIPLKLNNMTQVIQIPLVIPDIKTTKEKARKNIASIISKKLSSTDKIIILSGESNDGSFKRRAREVLEFAKSHPNIHVIMPLEINDERISGIDVPENAHAVGFRKDWGEIIPGGDIAFIRGSWGELIDLVSSETIPIITSPGTVPMDADLGTTQFLTEVSEERACNISLLIEMLQSQGVKTKTINGLLVDFSNTPPDKYTLREAIEHALRPDVANEIRSALLNIPRGISGCIGKLHEQLLDQKRIFSTKELAKIQKSIWSQD
ncbi:MAG: hypothetical protein ACD_15C00005G0012 [uncultured bacterium]|nr:MAG: hypothetical protein ACD_15C00005G0012 [uncultured bacterium]